MNYSKYERETIILMNDAENTANISTYQRHWIARLLKIAEEKPNEVTIVKKEEDYLEIIVPNKYVKVRPPRFVSDEQREAASKRLAEYRLKKTKE